MKIVEFIEAYAHHEGGDYIWFDNRGELIRCKDCEYHGKRTNMCDIWHAHTSPEGYCHRGKIYGKGE